MVNRISGSKRLLQQILDKIGIVDNSVSDLEVKINDVRDKLDVLILESKINNKHQETITEENIVEDDIEEDI